MPHIAIEGCCHGDLDKIYATLEHALEQKQLKDQQELALKSVDSDDDFLNALDEYKKPSIDLLLVCGDFESIRHSDDLNSMSVPDKYKEWKDFHKYFPQSQFRKEGEETKVAPMPTLFIGGNHEASLYLMSLPFGGFVTDKIYYMGNCGFIQFRKKYANQNRMINMRIGGWSGIYKDGDFWKDSARFLLPKQQPPTSSSSSSSTGSSGGSDSRRLHHLLSQESEAEADLDKNLGTTLFDEQHVPFSENAKRSVYHVRFFEFWKIMNMKLCLNKASEEGHSSQPLDIFLSHDWPTGVTRFGDLTNIKRFKDHVMKEIEDSDHKLGNPWGEKLLKELEPKFWFSAHMHCKFSSVVTHQETVSQSSTLKKNTKFLALDKCLPKRDFLQMVDMDHYIEYSNHQEDGNDKQQQNEENSEKEGEYYFDLDWLAITKLFHAYRYEISKFLKQPNMQKIQRNVNHLDANFKFNEIVEHVNSTSLPFIKNRMYPLFTLEEIEKEKNWIMERSKTFANGKFANLRIPTPSTYSLGNLLNSNNSEREALQMDPQTIELLEFLGIN